jgi:hypothetical protein
MEQENTYASREREALNREINAKIAKHDEGLFITVNSKHAESDLFTGDTARAFEKALNKVVGEVNRFCYGKRHKERQLQLEVHNALEVGKVNRKLHAHMLLFVPYACKRTFAELKQKIYTRLRGLTMVDKNQNAINIEDWVKDDERRSVEYITKSHDYMQGRYGVSFAPLG